jgi:hypothetical protein
MKTILRILIILIVAAILDGGFYWLGNNFALVSSTQNTETSIMPDQGEQQTNGEIPVRSESGTDIHKPSINQGLMDVFATLLKISAVTLFLLLIEKGIDLLTKKFVPNPAQEGL